jgi:uncharacterized RDD family membrane protein YckC
MTCPRCGDICHCHAGVCSPNGTQRRSRFAVDREDSSAAILVDPDQYDASEEQFSASLERAAAPGARFIPDEPDATEPTEKSSSVAPPACTQPDVPIRQASSKNQAALNGATIPVETGAATASEGGNSAFSRPSRNPEPLPPDPTSSTGAWKEELAARLNSYRAKRKPKPPKYPSLSLDFEPAFPATSGSGARTPDWRASSAAEKVEHQTSSDSPAQALRVVPAEDSTARPAHPSASGRLIEFPRFFGPEEPSPDQLAEPVCEQPRILEAPDVELPAPALGGIVLETHDEPETSGRPGFEVPLRSASISRRILAAAMDAVVITSSGILFACIFRQLVKVVPPTPQLLVSVALVLCVLWAGYQYLLLTYSGTTPGMQLARLRLADFDGTPVLRSQRRWRVLASLLSAVSLGLGFAWCFLDEDALCWHDRITHTHLVPRD